jgi:transcriptional regulator with XRE-family HTH domain
MPSSTYAEVIEGLRERGGLSFDDIALVVGAGRRSVSRWAHGEAQPRSPSRDRLLELAAVVAALANVVVQGSGTRVALRVESVPRFSATNRLDCEWTVLAHSKRGRGAGRRRLRLGGSASRPVLARMYYNDVATAREKPL